MSTCGDDVKVYFNPNRWFGTDSARCQRQKTGMSLKWIAHRGTKKTPSPRRAVKRYKGQIDLCMSSHVQSPTSALDDVIAAKARELMEYLKGLKPLPNQNGLVILINGVVVGLDVVSSVRAYQVLHQKFVRSYAMDAVFNEKPASTEKLREKAQAFLEASKASTERVYPAVGRGEDHRFQGAGIAGAALVIGDSVLHLNLYRN